MKKFRFGKPFMALAMLALALALGLAFVSCGDDEGGVSGGGGGGLSLRSGASGNRVILTINGVPPSSNFAKEDFVLTINGTNAVLTHDSESQSGSTTSLQIYFSSPAVTTGTSYAVTLVYSGSLVAPFTRSGTVTCQ